MKKETIKNAKHLLEVYPSMREMMNTTFISKVLNPLQIIAFRNSQEWEGISLAVNHICNVMMDRPFDEGYWFPGNSEKGEANVLPAYGDSIKIDSLTVYKALLAVMFCNWAEISLTIIQDNARLNFISDLTIYKILD